MSKEMVISSNPHETRVAIMEEGQLCEYYVERQKEFALVGSIYKGRVTRVLPGMQSAFVEIGLDSDAFLYVSDFLEEIEELDHIVTTVEDKVEKMEEQGGQVFPANTGTRRSSSRLDVESPRVRALGVLRTSRSPGRIAFRPVRGLRRPCYRLAATRPSARRPRARSRLAPRIVRSAAGLGGDRGGRIRAARR